MATKSLKHDPAAAQALDRLACAAPQYANYIAHRRGDDPRKVLGDVLIANDTTLPESVLTAIDSVYESAIKEKPEPHQLTPEGLPGVVWLPTNSEPRIVLWRGDVCTLAVDAVVNAANGQGLGCFVPEHRCIDNVLHRAAGPRLRESCREAITARPPEKRRLAAGTTPLVTKAHYLPAKAVLHITGPQLQPGRPTPPTETERSTLQACYTGCLDACKEHGLRSIAFCCISTWIFGYPQQAAAEAATEAAMEAVKGWIAIPEN